MTTIVETWDECWLRSRKGNLWQIIGIDEHTQITVTVFMRDGMYHVCLAGPRGRTDFIDLGHANETKARKQALEFVENML